jgi:hypothetical protein
MNDLTIDCPGCKGKLTLPETGEDWVHVGPRSMDCPMLGEDVPEDEDAASPLDTHPSLAGKQFGKVINVDFKNKKRLD